MTPEVEIQIRQGVKTGKLSSEDIKVLLRWVDHVEELGLEKTQRSARWHDHALEGEWFGYRSAAFSSSGRVIYRVEKEKIIVRVVRVTPDHDYARRG